MRDVACMGIILLLFIVGVGVFIGSIRDRGACLKWDIPREHTYFIGPLRINREIRVVCLQYERP